MTPDSRSLAQATLERHHRHDFGGCHMYCVGDFPCEAVQNAQALLEALNELDAVKGIANEAIEWVYGLVRLAQYYDNGLLHDEEIAHIQSMRDALKDLS